MMCFSFATQQNCPVCLFRLFSTLTTIFPYRPRPDLHKVHYNMSSLRERIHLLTLAVFVSFSALRHGAVYTTGFAPSNT